MIKVIKMQAYCIIFLVDLQNKKEAITQVLQKNRKVIACGENKLSSPKSFVSGNA